MTRLLLAMAAMAAVIGGVATVPAAAQRGDRVLLIYGNDRCPTTKTGDEIVVCRRLPEADRYRIPEALRDTPTTGPGNERWAERAASVAGPGTAATGPGTCTPSGGGDWTGCWSAQMKQAKAERQAKAQEDAAPQR